MVHYWLNECLSYKPVEVICLSECECLLFLSLKTFFVVVINLTGVGMTASVFTISLLSAGFIVFVCLSFLRQSD